MQQKCVLLSYWGGGYPEGKGSPSLPSVSLPRVREFGAARGLGANLGFIGLWIYE